MKQYTFIDSNTKIISTKMVSRNIKEISDKLGQSLIQFIQHNFDYDFHRIVRYCIKNDLNIETFKEHCMSKVNPTKFKVFDGNVFRHDTDDANYMRGNMYRGVKRYDHSLKLKNRPNIKNRRENWSKSRLEYSKIFNTVEWKRRVLENKNIITDSLTDSDIIKNYSKYRTNLVNSDSYKLTKVKKFIADVRYTHLYDTDYLKAQMCEDVNTAFKIMNSVIGIYHTTSNLNQMGNPVFTRKTFNPKLLTKCINSDVFTTRSSLESDFIYNFILPNVDHIDGWGYELDILKYENHMYITDFTIYISGEKYLVELKGYIRDETDFNKIVKKVNSVKGNYMFLSDTNISFEAFLKQKNMEIFKKTHAQTHIEPVSGVSIGLSKDSIISNLEPGDYFINNGLFFYTVTSNWDFANFYLILNNKCISEIQYDINTAKIISENTTSSRFSKKLLDSLELHINQFEYIKGMKLNAKN